MDVPAIQQGTDTDTSRRPTVLVLGATGQTGRLIVDELNDADSSPRDRVDIRIAARKPEDVDRLTTDGFDAVLLDFDDPRTFGPAMAGVDRLYLVTGYTVDMLVQSKTLVDAAAKAGVSHVVHQGVFANPDVTDPHFAWHQLVETYIEASGMAWTHLHPNFYMENLFSLKPATGTFEVHWGEQRVGWIAGADVARVAAATLREGPERHGGKNYWLSTEALSGPEVALLLTDVLGYEVRCETKTPDDMAGTPTTSSGVPMEAKYAEGAAEFVRQVFDGRMGYIGTARDDVPYVTGTAATTMRTWLEQNRDKLLEDRTG